MKDLKGILVMQCLTYLYVLHFVSIAILYIFITMVEIVYNLKHNISVKHSGGNGMTLELLELGH